MSSIFDRAVEYGVEHTVLRVTMVALYTCHIFVEEQRRTRSTERCHTQDTPVDTPYKKRGPHAVGVLAKDF